MEEHGDFAVKTEVKTEIQSDSSEMKRSLSPSDIRSCRALVSSLVRHQSSWPFRQPVDPVLSGAPDYLDIIKAPMDLSTIDKKLKANVYSQVTDVIHDIILMLSNCFRYNPSTNSVHQIGRNLEAYFSSQLTKIFPAFCLIPNPTGGAMMLSTASVNTPPPAVAMQKRPIKVPEPTYVPDVSSKRPPKSRKSDIVPLDAKTLDLMTRKAMKSAKRSRVERDSSEDEAMDYQITALASTLQTVSQQLASLSGGSKGKKTVATKTVKKPKQLVLLDENTIDEDCIIDHSGGRTCLQCQTTSSSVWRPGPTGMGTLCNRCGVHWRNAEIISQLNEPAPKPVAAPISVPRTSKKKATFSPEQKQELTEMIGMLSGDVKFMNRVIAIITQGMPHLKDMAEEMELDLNVVPPATLNKLYAFAKKTMDSAGISLSQKRPQKPKPVVQAATAEDSSDDDSDDSSD
jgi:hypothetical protein